jgi:hypothetical protein
MNGLSVCCKGAVAEFSGGRDRKAKGTAPLPSTLFISQFYQFLSFSFNLLEIHHDPIRALISI